MKVILAAVNAKFIHSNPAIKSLYLYSGDLKDYMEMCEFTINQDRDYILGQLYQRKPDVICFSCYLWNIDIITDIITELAKVLPRCDLWLGGPEVSYDSEDFLIKQPEVTGIMRGEGEEVFRRLLLQYVSGERDFSRIPGLVYRTGKTVTDNGEQKLLSMDVLPFLYEDPKPLANRIIYYESSRGCPYGCSYCMSSIDKGVRFRNLQTVLSELQFFLDRRVLQVKFLDRTFNINHERTEVILRFLLAHDNGVTNFHFEISADILTDEEIALLGQLRPGQVQLEIGVQTTNPDTLRAIHRQADYRKLCENVRQIRQKGNVLCHLDLIAGLPLENLESFTKSFDDVYQLQPNQLQIGFLKVLKGSPMQADARRYGIVSRKKAPYEVLYTDALPYTDVLRLKGVEEMVEVYYNSGLFPVTLRFLERFHAGPFELYDSLWRFYLQNGYDGIKHSRISRYEILYDYIKNLTEPEIFGMLEQVLLFDLYSRENLKSPPKFAASAGNDRKTVRGLYSAHSAEYKGKDIHIEAFSIDLRAMENGELRRGREFALFDYYSRNPVSKMAEYRILSL